jgi:hypothetical protein
MSSEPERTPLVVGDVIEGAHRRRYHVIGFTRGDKLRLLRQREGTEFTAWWSTREDLPPRHRWVMWMGSGSRV